MSTASNFYLATLQMVYKETQETTEVFIQTVNTVIALDSPFINAYSLNVLTKSAQAEFLNTLGGPVHIIDSPILNIVSLGHMTPEEFKAMPNAFIAKEEKEQLNLDLDTAISG